MKFELFAGLFVLCCVSGNALALSNDQRPDYQKEYDAYLQDLQFIEQKGYAPKNSILEDDLAKMNSERRIRLTNPLAHAVGAGSSEHLKVAENDSDKNQNSRNDAEVVSRVEIIHVPEEFREQYAKIYAEETKHISAQSLAKEQEEDRQKALENEEALKIAEHNNPFRLLKEKELETDVSNIKKNSGKKKSVTDAYFQGQKRAYVSGKPIIIEKKKTENVVKKAENKEQKEAPSPSPDITNNIPQKAPAESHIYHSGKKGHSSSEAVFGTGARINKMFLE